MIENKSPGGGISGYDPSLFKQERNHGHTSLISAHVGSRSPPPQGPGSPRPMSPPSSPGSSPPRSTPKSDSAAPGLPPSMYPPPGFPPQGVLLPNLSSPFSRPSDFLLGSPMSDIHYNRHQSLQMVSPNDPTANACKIVDFHGEKIASFSIHGKTMLCLPQAFEIFLKNLVGGLHTVYTKCKRLGINPLVCNVEQVRVLRGLGSIQPGVNRCKLIADTDFEELMRDCNTSRPGRPPKRMTPITTFANMSTPDPSFLGAMSMSNLSQGGIPFPPPHPARDLPPGFNPFLPLGGSHSPASQAALAQHAQAQAAILSRNGLLQGANPSQHEVMLEKYGNMLRHLQGLQKEDRGSPPPPASPTGSPPALNLSYRSEDDKHDDISDKSESELADIEDEGEEMDDNISEDNSIEAASGNGNGFPKKMVENGKENGLPPVSNPNMFHFLQNIQGTIQDLVKQAMTNAKDDEESKSEDSHSQKDGHDVEKQLAVEKESLENLRKQIEEAQKQSELYLKRFKKEKRLRRKIQSQLEIESFKKAKLEEALSTLSYKTFLQVKDLRNNETNDKENFA